MHAPIYVHTYVCVYVRSYVCMYPNKNLENNLELAVRDIKHMLVAKCMHKLNIL